MRLSSPVGTMGLLFRASSWTGEERGAHIMNEEELRNNLEEWLENPYWAEYYRKAPSERCRQFIALEFHYSEYEDGFSAGEMDRIEAEMDAGDLRHLLNFCGNSPRRKELLDRITRRGTVDNGPDSSHT